MTQIQTHLYLIRHGEAVSNVEPIIGGLRGDGGLTPRGVAQATRLRDRLAATGEIEADVLIASTFPRARQTAEIIAPALGLPIVWDPEVQEMRPGEADGLTLDQFRERYGAPDFEKDPFRPLAPEGESWATFYFRCAAAFDRIAREHEGRRVVIVCHGGVIDNSFLYFCGVNPLPRPDIEFYTRNTSITHWEHFARADRSPRWRLRRYNDAAHLHDIPVAEPPDWRDVATSTMQGEGEGGPSVPLPTEEGDQ